MFSSLRRIATALERLVDLYAAELVERQIVPPSVAANVVEERLKQPGSVPRPPVYRRKPAVIHQVERELQQEYQWPVSPNQPRPTE